MENQGEETEHDMVNQDRGYQGNGYKGSSHDYLGLLGRDLDLGRFWENVGLECFLQASGSSKF